MKKLYYVIKRSFLFMLVFSITFILTGCFGGNSTGGVADFTWWISRTDGMGTFYQDYEDNPGVQWINNQYWDIETGTYSKEGNGTKLNFDFQVPVTGSESDNFNTMIATGSYPEILDLVYSVDSPRDLYEEGVLIEITDYVHEYMPDYLAFLDKHPEVKPFVTHTDENGEVHYYGLWSFNSATRPAWQGYVYRRDWLVKYAEPTSHVWDLDSTYVMENGHPKYTPLSEAVNRNDYTGWETNSVTSFTSNFGDEETWEDNIIFPSGTDKPIYISDWEWMLDAFLTAIDVEGFSDNNNAYPMSLYYLGYNETGDLVSSFGGGGPMWYLDENKDAAFGATGDNFKTYLEAMHSWYENDWIDSAFETRSRDMFWKINLTGISQGMVGMWQSGSAYLGTTIRATVENEEAQEDAMVFPSPLPINDVYGSDEQKFNEPDTYYGANLLNGPTGFTSKIEDKDVEALFTMLNWFYTEEGALLSTFGLSEEQYQSMDFSPDLYAEYGLTNGYTVEENGDGKVTYVASVSQDLDLSNAIRPMRMSTNMFIYSDDEVTVDPGHDPIVANAKKLWSQYENTGYILDYEILFDESQSSMYSQLRTYINDSLSVEVPGLIKEGLSDWDTYVNKINKYGPNRVTGIFQAVLDNLEHFE